MTSPFEADRINRILASLHQRACAQLDADGAPRVRQHFRFSVDMRHKGQINEVEVGLDGETIDDKMLDTLRDRFIDRYERLYGRGASLEGARLELVAVRCRASADTAKPSLQSQELRTDGVPEFALRPTRPVYWSEFNEHRETAVYDGHSMNPGNTVPGPAIVELDTTTVVVRPDQVLNVDAYGNLEIVLEPAPGAAGC